MLPFYVYIFKCSDGSFYTGHTDNLKKRIIQHKEGFSAGYTASRLPVILVFYQEFTSRYEALVAEHKIKTWSRRKKEILITKGWQGIIEMRVKK